MLLAGASNYGNNALQKKSSIQSYQYTDAHGRSLLTWFAYLASPDHHQVCGAVAAEELSKGRLKIIGANTTPAVPFRIGRYDRTEAAPAGTLPAENVTVSNFAQFWKDRKINMTEAVALMGSHGLIDTQVSSCKPEHHLFPSLFGVTQN